jgi:7-carboxy-7-deazaguanine synthase
MKISEIFLSIQGEGKLTGVPSLFIRTSGCNLRCVWCDTPYSSWNPIGETMTVSEILKKAQLHGTQHVVITGGEPLMQPQLPELVAGLRTMGRHITVETAGTLWQDVPMDLASISPKLSHSTPFNDTTWSNIHQQRRLNWDVLATFARSPLITERQWKFVICKPEDMAEVDAIVNEISSLTPIPPADVILMPEGVQSEALQARGGWLADICRERGFRFGMRLHILLYGNTRGT